MDLRASFASVQAVMGLPATVTLPDGGSSVETVAVWLLSSTDEYPHGTGLRRAEAKRILCLSKADVPEVPRLTVVNVAEEEGGDVLSWRVDSTEKIEFDNTRVFVVPNTEES